MEISNNDISLASRIVEQVLNGDGGLPSLELDNNLVISDFEYNVELFLSDLQIAEGIGGKFPALVLQREDGLVPLSFSAFWEPIGLTINKQLLMLYLNNKNMYYFLSSLVDKEEKVQVINVNDAIDAFTEHAIRFIATRIAGVREFQEGDTRRRTDWEMTETLSLLQFSGGNRITTPGCNFSVSTNSNGLRVFWSGAYYISPNYFSHPTSPVSSILQAGTYIFGVDGGAYGGNINWDTNAVVSLPGNNSLHLNY